MCLPSGERAALKAGIEDDFENIMNALVEMDAEKAEAFKESDRDMIFHAIREDGGFAKLNNLVKDQLREWFVETGADMAEEIIAAGGEEAESVAFRGFIFNLSTSLVWCGENYAFKGERDRSIEYYERSLNIQIATLGENHDHVLLLQDTETSTLYNKLGSAYDSKGEYDRAIEYYERDLKTHLATLGENHPDTAALYNNLGSTYDSKGEYDRAIEYYERALKITLAPGPWNYTADSYNYLGNTYKKKGEYDRAIEYYEKARHIWADTFGEDYPMAKMNLEEIQKLTSVDKKKSWCIIL